MKIKCETQRLKTVWRFNKYSFCSLKRKLQFFSGPGKQRVNGDSKEIGFGKEWSLGLPLNKMAQE